MDGSWKAHHCSTIAFPVATATARPKARPSNTAESNTVSHSSGIALRGHKESEGNLHHLLLMWSKNDEIVQSWLRENRYTSHQVVNELITILGQSLLRNLLGKMKDVTGPAWFSIIADEATDVASSEQLNLTIRCVTDGYEVHEDPVGLF